MRRTFAVLVRFCITLTTFHARITTIHLYLLYLKHYWFHFSRTRCINKYTQAYTSSNTEKAMLTQEVNTKVTIKYENIKRLLLIWFMQRLLKCACTLFSKQVYQFINFISYYVMRDDFNFTVLMSIVTVPSSFTAFELYRCSKYCKTSTFESSNYQQQFIHISNAFDSDFTA